VHALYANKWCNAKSKAPSRTWGAPLVRGADADRVLRRPIRGRVWAGTCGGGEGGAVLCCAVLCCAVLCYWGVAVDEYR